MATLHHGHPPGPEQRGCGGGAPPSASTSKSSSSRSQSGESRSKVSLATTPSSARCLLRGHPPTRQPRPRSPAPARSHARRPPRPHPLPLAWAPACLAPMAAPACPGEVTCPPATAPAPTSPVRSRANHPGWEDDPLVFFAFLLS
jgi:hypothetical protein